MCFSIKRVDIERRAPALSSDNVIIDTAIALKTENVNVTEYELKFHRHSCNDQEDDFELFGIDGTDIIGLNLTGLSIYEAHQARRDYLKTADNATFSSPEWLGGTVTIRRKQRASRALTGNWTLSWQNHSAGNGHSDPS